MPSYVLISLLILSGLLPLAFAYGVYYATGGALVAMAIAWMVCVSCGIGLWVYASQQALTSAADFENWVTMAASFNAAGIILAVTCKD